MHKNKWKNIQKRMMAAMLGTIIAMSSFQTVYATKQDVEAAKKKVSSIEEEKKKGVHFFILEVRESNLSAQHCYEKLGFKSIGIRKNFYDCPRENALIMQMESIAGDE